MSAPIDPSTAESQGEDDGAPPPATLHRTLGLWVLVFYGLGSIIGAGIYVLVGAVAAASGMGAPLAFLAAGVLAGLTGLSYAELSARYPEAAGAAAYVQEGFARPWLAQLTGFAVVAVGIFLIGSLAHGAVGYLANFVAVPPRATALALIAGFAVIAGFGVGHSLRLAAAMTLVEIGGLVVVLAAGAPALAHLPDIAPAMVPASSAAVLGVAAGSFLAFFAFLGFEDIVNMAEETRDPGRTLPRAIVLAIGLATAIYALVALVAVAAVPIERLAGSRAPLEMVVESAAWLPKGTLAAVALIAIPNGILITLVMLARILYGMARRGWLPAALAHVNPTTRTPLRTTALAAAIAIALTAAIDFIGLVKLTSAINLGVFILVNLALMRLHASRPLRGLPIHVPRWCPPLAAALSAALLGAALLG